MCNPIEQWRDCNAWKEHGFVFTTTSDNVLRTFDEVLFEFITNRGDVSVSSLLKQIEEEDPSFIMGKVLKFLSGDGKVLEEIKLSFEKNQLSRFEQLHCKAVIAYAKDDIVASCNVWTSIVNEFPRDPIAIKMAWFQYLRLGDSIMLRDLVTRVLPFFEKSNRYYGYLLNRLAFGLEETNFLDKAEETVNEGLSLVPEDYWGLHTKAHVYETKCQFNEGIEFLERTESTWSKQGLACHMYWHLSLYYNELGNYQRSLQIFDENMIPRIKDDPGLLFIGDGVQALQRLEFNNFPVGNRWDGIYEVTKVQNVSNTISLYLPHIYLSYLKSSEAQQCNHAKTFVEMLEKFILESESHDAGLSKQVILPMVNAMHEYCLQRYTEAFDIMYPLKNKIIKLGYSHAQRDFFSLFLIDCCIRSPVGSLHRNIGKCLLNERKFLKQNSPMTDRMIEAAKC